VRPVLPSGWSCAGLIHHLAIDVEQFWFTNIMSGERLDDEEDDERDAWHLPPGLSPAAALSTCRETSEVADAVIAHTALDEPPRWWPDRWSNWRLDDLQAVMLHVITETACHAGHLDAARELIDRRQWLVLTE
jgi:hypothetical protein